MVGFRQVHGDELSAPMQSTGILPFHGFLRDGNLVGGTRDVGFLVDSGLSFKSDDGTLIPVSSSPPQAPYKSIKNSCARQLHGSKGLRP